MHHYVLKDRRISWNNSQNVFIFFWHVIDMALSSALTTNVVDFIRCWMIDRSKRRHMTRNILKSPICLQQSLQNKDNEAS